jgi:hypothetical protein
MAAVVAQDGISSVEAALVAQMVGPPAMVVRGPFSPAERVMMHSIASRAVATYAHMIHDLYASDPNGGPLDPKGCIATMMVKLRRKLRERGVHITTWRGEGYCVTDEMRGALKRLLEVTRAGGFEHAIDLPPR